MTDPELAGRTYVEPLAPETVARILELAERPMRRSCLRSAADGPQLALALDDDGTLDDSAFSLIGASAGRHPQSRRPVPFPRGHDEIGLALPCSDTRTLSTRRATS